MKRITLEFNSAETCEMIQSHINRSILKPTQRCKVVTMYTGVESNVTVGPTVTINATVDIIDISKDAQ